ncbi:gliding motility-associated C-terminal domain-containing protein [Hymenobacter sp. BT683]|uniref:Gliding motility-associated C-terminal domain-containing protein n=1 Tax=Hymenobacter jeongseonensis TaxID=2791027 RepID=A0ABS0IKA9_9BACT|nr:gliding motility-associated C-terminal domain-containing protein [Hymenobacter jeongseonensis]MBF9238814.1 gliding motility-associated C-terminal domain-containing protein [Hymenobacter jeongseonensis]
MPFRLMMPGPGWSAVLLWLGSWLMVAAPAKATHIVGGEMELVHNSGDSYTLLLNLYFDAVHGSSSALDAELTASIFEKGSNRRMANVVLPLTSNTFVDYANPACATPSLSTRKMVYSRAITLAANTYANAQGYYVAVERCCRNEDISNIVEPDKAAQAFYLEFPAVVRRGQPFLDSTPSLFPALAEYACRNELFYYDFSGRDADGDSLTYDLVTPLNGNANAVTPKPATASAAPYDLIQWIAGLGTANQIPGKPTLAIDALKGRLTVQPLDTGLFAFGVRCTEYRRGEKIGETRRDFQLKVLDCAPNATPSLVLLPAPTGRVPYRPGRDTLRLVSGGNRCVRLRFTDPDPSSRLSLSLSPVNFSGLLPNFTTASSGAVRTPGAPDTLTTTMCFPECIDTQGRVFYLDVVVADDGCSQPKRDTVRVAFMAVPPANSRPTIVTTASPTRPLRVQVGDLLAFDVIGTDADRDAIQLEMTGQGFNPTDIGAALSQGTVGTQQRGRFTWRVDCRAVGADSVLNFQFTAATSPCDVRQATVITVPVVVSYTNRPPTLTSTLPVAQSEQIPVIELPLGQVYTATFRGVDLDRDGLTLTATGSSENGKEGFDLALAGMRFEAQNGTGAANGTFRWDVSCAAANLHRNLTVTFQLIDATCKPLPQVQRIRLQVTNPDSLGVTLYNVITPNRDGQNDEFRLPDLPPNFCDMQFANVRIFTRWGQQVFSSSDRNFRWAAGQDSAGMYYYFVTYNDGRKYRGWLEVVK